MYSTYKTFSNVLTRKFTGVEINDFLIMAVIGHMCISQVIRFFNKTEEHFVVHTRTLRYLAGSDASIELNHCA